MPWPVPAPGAVSSRAAAVYEALFPGIDARSGKTVASAACETLEAEVTTNYLYQRYLGDELMPDTAVDNLPRLADMWGEPRNPPQIAVGYGAAAGTPGLAIPAGLQAAAPDGTLFQTTLAGVADANGNATGLSMAAVNPGASGNQPGGTVLTLVSPLLGLNPQTITLDDNGAAGGADLEDVDAWRARVVARVRRRGQAGSADDFAEWVAEAGAAYSATYSNWVGPGTVGVVIAMPGPLTPTPAQIASVNSFLQTVRPVACSELFVVGAQLVPMNVTVHLNPDTVAIRTAATNAYNLWFVTRRPDGQRNAEIGQPGYLSSLTAALQTTTGETSHTIISPPADVVVANNQLLVPGTLSFA